MQPKGRIQFEGQRALRVILPQGTRYELARRAVDSAVVRWVEAMERRGMRLTSDIAIEGPHFCPFLKHYGEDMWIAVGRFRAERLHPAREDVILKARELHKRLGVAPPRESRALPPDWRDQLAFVKENKDKVYDDLREMKRLGRDPDPD